MKKFALFTRNIHNRFNPKEKKPTSTKGFCTSDPKRYCYGCGRKDQLVCDCPDIRKRMYKDMDNNKRPYFKSTKSKVPSWVCKIALRRRIMKMKNKVKTNKV